MEYLVANSVSELVKRSDLLGLTNKDKIIIGTSVSLGTLSIILAILTWCVLRSRRQRYEYDEQYYMETMMPNLMSPSFGIARLETARPLSSPSPSFYHPQITRPTQTLSPYDYQVFFPYYAPENVSPSTNTINRVPLEPTINVNINKNKKDSLIAWGMLAATFLSTISAIVVPVVLKYT